jgi:hypothetical protein
VSDLSGSQRLPPGHFLSQYRVLFPATPLALSTVVVFNFQYIGVGGNLTFRAARLLILQLQHRDRVPTIDLSDRHSLARRLTGDAGYCGAYLSCVCYFYVHRPSEDSARTQVLSVLSVYVFWREEAGELAIRV